MTPSQRLAALTQARRALAQVIAEARADAATCPPFMGGRQ